MATPAVVIEPKVSDVFGFIQSSFKNDIFILSNCGDIDAVRELLPKIDINSRDSKGNTALHYAVHRGNEDLVTLLLDHNIDVHSKNNIDGHTALHWACTTNNFRCARLLIDKGRSDILLGDNRGYNAIHTASMNGHLNLLHYLLLNYSSKKSKDGDGGLTLRCGANASPDPSIQNIIDSRDLKGHTALHWAAYKGHSKIVMYLLRQGANIDATDQLGNSALHWASQQQQLEVIAILTRAGANIEIKDSKSQSPVIHAIKKSSLSTAYALMISNNIPWTFKELYSSHATKVSLIASPALYLSSIFSSYLLPFWLWSIFVTLQIFLILVYVGPYIRKSPAKNPFFVTMIVTGTSIISTWFFVLTLSGHEAFMRWENIFFWFLVPSMYISLYKTTKNDPGIIEPLAHVENTQFINDLFAGRDPKLCPTCLSRRPIRSKHCKQCNACIAGLDHHCNWVNNCVGYKNVGSFFVFLLSIIGADILAFYFFCIHLGLLFPNDGPGSPGTPWNILYHLGTYWVICPGLICCMFLLLVTLILQGLALYNQIRNLLDGWNQFERARPKLFSYLWKDGKLISPFHQGFVANLKAFFYPTVDYHHLFYEEDIGNTLLAVEPTAKPLLQTEKLV